MTDSQKVDFYEVLQVSPNADTDTVERVFRHLAKRFHPDNTATGNHDRFTLVLEAFQTLSDAERRASYDLHHDAIRESQWNLLDQASAGDDVESDRRLRLGILSLLYSARRQDVDDPGVGVYEIERLLGCPEHHMKFHIWYLKSNGWVERLENGQYAITASGVDRMVESDIPWKKGPLMLKERASERGEGSDEAGGAAQANGNGNGNGAATGNGNGAAHSTAPGAPSPY